MTALTERASGGSLALKEEELISVLSSSVYPGAKLESIKMVINYCTAAQLDPLQKPVHIVPMSVKVKGQNGQRDRYEWRDVIMPGIGLYRIQAARGGRLAGIDEPEFGPMVDFPAGGKDFKVPEWCRVTVYRMVDGQPRAFTALEFWSENYATAGRDTEEPNAMWRRRSRGQIAKCAEAQALRKAFPEIGAQPTAEEMEGRSFDDMTDINDPPAAEPSFKVGKRTERKPETYDNDQPVAEQKPAKADNAKRENPPEPAPDDAVIGVGEANYLKNKAAAVDVDLDQLLKSLGGLSLEGMTKSDFHRVKAELLRAEG